MNSIILEKYKSEKKVDDPYKSNKTIFNKIINFLRWSIYGLEFILLVNMMAYIFGLIGAKKLKWKCVQICAKRALKHFGVEVMQKGSFPKNYNCNTIIISNHKSWFDILLLIALFPKRIVFFAKKDFFNFPILGTAMRIHKHIAVDKFSKGNYNETEEKVLQSLKENAVLCIFPEGTRYSKEGMLPFKKGAYQLAKKFNATIIPVYHYGAEKILVKEKGMFENTPGKIQVYIDSSFTLDEKNITDNQELEEKYKKRYNQYELERGDL
jgi:1-acyl-sn-glycerol-3-phosphate acyltransferase